MSAIAVSTRPAVTTRSVGVAKTLGTWMARHRQRMTLASLDARQLADIGIDAMTAQFEASKPFWSR